MTARGDAERAYITFLHACEERDSLLRYKEFLVSERHRLRQFSSEVAAHAQEVPWALGRALRHTFAPLDEAVLNRLRIVEEELDRVDDRVVSAEQHVEECNDAHRRLSA